MFKTKKSIASKYFFPLSAILIFIIAFLFFDRGIFLTVDHYFYDQCLFLNQEKSKCEEITVIKIDSKSLEELGNWPWKRKIHANLVNKLSKYNPAVIAFYMRFNLSGDEEDNINLANALKKSPSVLLDNNFHTFNSGNTLNSLNLIRQSSAISHSINISDIDQVVRKELIYFNNQPDFALNVLSQLKTPELQYSLSEQKNNEILYFKGHKLLVRDNAVHVLINYKRTLNKYTKISYTDALNERFLEKNSDLIANRIILIGLTVQGLQAKAITPLSRISQEKGTLANSEEFIIFLQAQMIDNLKNFPLLFPINTVVYGIILLIFCFLIIYFNSKLMSFPLLIIELIAISFLVVSCSYLFYGLLNVWMPVSGFMIIILMAFFQYSFIFIYRTTTFLDKLFPESKQLAETTIGGLESRLDNVRDLITNIQNDKETLEVIFSSIDSYVLLLKNSGEILYSNDKNMFPEKGFWGSYLNKDEFDNLIKVINEKKEVEKRNQYSRKIL